MRPTWVLTVFSSTVSSCCDFGVGKPLGYVAQHLSFAWGQCRKLFGGGGAGTDGAHELLDEPAGDGGVDESVTGGHATDGGHQVLAGCVFEQESAGSGA